MLFEARINTFQSYESLKTIALFPLCLPTKIPTMICLSGLSITLSI